MKKLILVLLDIIGFLVSSCDKEEIRLSQNYFGTAKVLKNSSR